MATPRTTRDPLFLGRWFKMKNLKSSGEMQTVSDWDQLDRELTVHMYRDLLCRF